MKCIIVDFFYVKPGPGVSERIAKKLFDLLGKLKILKRLLAVVSDNGSDALKAAKLLSEHISEEL